MMSLYVDLALVKRDHGEDCCNRSSLTMRNFYTFNPFGAPRGGQTDCGWMGDSTKLQII